ncbi:di-heme oxidoredictase family protein [Prochlorococcus sp. MIT 1303]|uniref:di-heme oxidoredictase family protein n=1 Tax=Prochlorococcus sp. MIT 1303 TaxID=1723647 RepID=UPI0035141F4C
MQSASCHVPSQRTGNNQQAVAKVINHQTIWAYTDLLLHEIGPGLDDGFAEEGLSLSSQWQTPPLWGLAMTQTQRVNRQASFLHDGRACSIEEAIIWNAGEATTA